MKRRSFIRHAVHAVGIPALTGLPGLTSFAGAALSGETDKVLVMIYLQGGNDGLNTLVPLDQMSALNKVRPHVILPDNKLLTLNGTSLALHPSLTGLKSLFNEDRLRIVQSVGYPDQNYSHFRSTDIWMSGSGADELVTSGWTGRYLSQQFPGYPDGYPNQLNPHPLSIEIGYGSSMLFQGPDTSMGMVINDPNDFYELVNNTGTDVPLTPAGDKLKHIRLIARQSQLYGEVVKKAADKIKQQKIYPDTDIANQLKVVARLVAGGLKTSLYLVRIDGFDTHDNQVTDANHTLGEHAVLLRELNDAIMAFLNDLKFLGVDERVTGMTFSEFGRRIVSNASLGTDHGSAAPVFIFGNQLVSGVLGTNPVISSSATYKDNLPMLFDFRQVYGAVLQQWFDKDRKERQDILFNDFETIPLIKSGPLVGSPSGIMNTQFRVYPNPFKDQVEISYPANGEIIQIDLFDLNGKWIENIFTGKPVVSLQVVRFQSTRISKGLYYILFRNGSFRQTIKVLKL